MKKLIITLFIGLLSQQLIAQVDQSLLKDDRSDSLENAMNMDALSNRVYATSSSPVSIGGYLEADYKYIGEDGLTDGHSFRIPRVTLFITSSISSRIKFMSI